MEKNNSLKYIKSNLIYKDYFLDKQIEEMWELQKEFSEKLISENLRSIYSNEGLECELKDEDTGQTKIVKIKYENTDNFSFLAESSSLITLDKKEDIKIYIENFNNILSKFLWGNLDIGPHMPLHYDLDYEKENFSANNKEEFFKNVKETYYDYDVIYTIGNFVCFKEINDKNKLEALVNGIFDISSQKGTMKYNCILPYKIEYVLKENKN